MCILVQDGRYIIKYDFQGLVEFFFAHCWEDLRPYDQYESMHIYEFVCNDCYELLLHTHI
jgi:hypothetical protein